MLYTSYFAKSVALKESGIVQVAISRSTPDFFNGLSYTRLAPSWDILKKYKADGNWDEYVDIYTRDILDKLNPRIVYDEIVNMVVEVTCRREQDIALLCWEKSNCHRHLVSAWFNKNGILCKEWFN